MTDPTPGDWTTWPESALALLDSLVALQRPENVIRDTLYFNIGVRPTASAIRGAANRWKTEPKQEQSEVKTVDHDGRGLITIPIMTTVPRQRAQAPKRVAPGTFPTRNFSMIGGRIR